MHRIAYLVAFLALSSFCLGQESARTKAATGPSEVKVSGEVKTPLVLSLEDLKKMPRKTLRVENPHTKKAEVYEGVAIAALLEKAGVPHDEQIRGRRWQHMFWWRLRTIIASSFHSRSSIPVFRTPMS